MVKITSKITMEEHQKSKWDKVKGYLLDNLLVILLFVSICLGIGLGAAMREANLDDREKMYFAYVFNLI